MNENNPYGLNPQAVSNMKVTGSAKQLATVASQGQLGGSLNMSTTIDGAMNATMMQSQTLGHNVSQETLGALNMNRSEMLFGHESQEEPSVSKAQKAFKGIEVDELDQMLDVKEANLNKKSAYASEQSFRSGRTGRSARSGKSKDSKGAKNVVLTAKEVLERRHQRHLRDLEVLTSEDCPKKHPFDFGYAQLAQIKALFPEHQPKQSSTKGSKQADIKSHGLALSELKIHFADIMGLDLKENPADQVQISKLMERLDHSHSEKITWQEFLKFLDREGMRREVVNDAQLYGIGVKRMKEMHRVELKQGGVSQIDQQFANKMAEDDKFKNTDYIGSCVYINIGRNFKLLLALFENTENPLAMVYDTRAFQSENENELKQVAPMYEFQFKSNYARPKDKSHTNKYARPQSQAGSGMPNQLIRQSANNIFDKGDDANSKNFTSVRGGSQKSWNQFKGNLSSGPNSTFTSQRGQGQIQSMKKLGAVQGSILEEDSVYGAGGSSMSSTIQPSGHSNMPPTSRQGVMTKSQQKLPSVLEPMAINRTQKAVRTHSSSTKKREIALAQKNNLNNSLNYRSAVNLDIIQEKSTLSNFNSAKPYANAVSQNKIPKIQKLSSGLNQSFHDEKLREKLNRKKLIKDIYTKKFKPNSQKSSYVLGLDPLQDEEGSSAYFAGKDMEKDTSGYGVRFLLENLHQDCDKNKKKFDKFLEEKGREIKKIDKLYDTIDVPKKFPVRNNDLDEKMKRTSSKMEGQSGKLQKLEETNKYYYGITAPSPRTVALELDKKRQMEKKGVDTTNYIEVKKYLTSKGEYKPDEMAKRITGDGGARNEESKNYCTPDDITKYVEKLRAADKASGISQYSKEYYSTKSVLDHPAKAKRREQMEIKKIYAPCATYNQELQILALALIDKEIKVYKVKQNGKKIHFVDIFQHKDKPFTSRFIVTCICIERYVSNNRPILCMGSQSGDIAMYYLDEPIINKITGKPWGDGRVQDKELERSPFNIFNPHESPRDFGGHAGANVYQNDDNVIKEVPFLKNGQTIGSEDQTISRVSSQFNDIKGRRGDAKTSIKLPKRTEEKSEKATEITEIKYIRDIGLVVSTFNGTIKFFEAISFSEKWANSNKNRNMEQHTNITTFDISVKMGVMATGGVEGKIILIDPYARKVQKNWVQAHQSEILKIYIYEEQQQIISISQDRHIGLWDASRLDKIEVIKDDRIPRQAPQFSSCTFDQDSGQLFVGCHRICVWKAQVNDRFEINALQVQALSKEILKERQMLDHQDPGYDPKLVSKKKKDTDAKTGKVLVTSASTLVDIVIDQADSMHFLITIDSENLLRGWSTRESLTKLSYRIPVQHRVTAATVDNTSKFLAVGTNSGETKIINLRSGGVLYNLAHCNSEVTELKFFDGMTELWLFGACWGGKLMMWSKPTVDNNFTVAAKCRVGHKHDVLALDCSSNFIVSGGVDGIVSVWNVFSGQLKYAIQLSKPAAGLSPAKASFLEELSSSSSSGSADLDASPGQQQENQALNDLKRSVVGLCFHPHWKSHICVLLEGGDIHMIDATNGETSHKNLAKAKMNSNWACDPEAMTMLVVGDVGRASLFDISMGAKEDPELPTRVSSSKSRSKRSAGNLRQIGQRTISKQQMKWPIVQPWFVAHKIYKSDPAYVVSVKFVEVAKVFVSGTTCGEVKLWHNQTCECLGHVNSENWDPTDILAHITDFRNKQKPQQKQKNNFLVMP